MEPNRDPLLGQKSANIKQKCNRDSSNKKTSKSFKNDRKTNVHDPKNQAFRLKRLHLFGFTASAKKCAKCPKNAPWNNPKTLKITTKGFPKALPKTSIQMDNPPAARGTKAAGLDLLPF